MDMSMSTVSALGILTNSEPLKGIPLTRDTDKSDKANDVKLIFLNTFFHVSNELHADLIQIKEPNQIKEIRVIPLGATVNLSTGSYQLGATNPSELDLEFYYNDLQMPSKSAFTLLQNFSFNDKCRIHLSVDKENQIITDGLLVRGVYSTITLAVYGFPVDEVPLKEQITEPPPPSESTKEDYLEVSPVLVIASPTDDSESPKKSTIVASSEKDNSLVSPTSDETQPDLPPLQYKGTPRSTTPTLDSKQRAADNEPPRAIPTITTRSSFTGGGSREDQLYTEEPIDREREFGESDLSSEDHFDQKSEVPSKPQTLPLPLSSATTAPVPMEVVEDVEDISDGEVFPEEEDDANDEEKAAPVASNVVLKEKVIPIPTPTPDIGQTLSPAIEPLSDQEDSLLDDFQEPGIEEIDSEEDIPDFPEYEYGEWEDHWAQIFGSSFNPFSETFQVKPLKNFKIYQTLGPTTISKTTQEVIELFTSKSQEWSKTNFKISKMEAWVEDMEHLIPLIPRCFTSENEPSDAILENLLYWGTIAVDLSLAKKESSLAFKTRHIKVGIKLVHALALTGNKLVEETLRYKIEENSVDGGKTFQQKLIEIFEEQYMSATMRLSILRALDSLVLTKLGYQTFVGNEEEDSCYGRLVEFVMDKNVGTRVSYSIRSFLKKIKLLEDLRAFEEFVLGLVKNSSSELSTSVEAQDVDDCVHILETLRDMAKNVHQYLSHPLRILPAGSLVELPPPSVSGHDPQVSFVKSLEQYHFIKLCTVLVNNKDLFGRTGGLVTEIISILVEWDPGLVYLSSESESTTILLKTLAQLEEDGNGIPLYVCHCLEVMKCIDRLSDESERESQAQTEEEKNEDIVCLQTLVSFLCTHLGRQSLISTLTIGDLILPLLKCLKPTENSKFGRLSRMEITVRKGYASRIVGFLVRNGEKCDFLMRHGTVIHEIVTTMEEDAEGISATIRDMVSYLRCTLDPLAFSLEGIEELFGIVKSSHENLLRLKTTRNNWGYPSELITALRLLCAQVVPVNSDDVTNCIAADTDDMLIKELQYEVALVKLHSVDAISTFLAILQKIVDDFNGQPSTQSYTFVTGRGDTLINLLSPMMRMIRRMISQVVHVRKTEFKDTTPIPTLLRVFSIIEFVPKSAPCFKRSREVGQNIIGSLLAYTIPALRQGVETEEELNKSTWTALISEIIKFTMDEPATFQTGVCIFSEMLPLPLPIASKVPLTEAECSENVKLRRLWSAYIHGLSTQIQEMIGVLCGSTNSRLIALLKRLCVQLADLSGSTCMVVCRAVLDAIMLSIEADTEPQQNQADSYQQQSVNSSQNSSIKAWLDQSKTPKLLVCSSTTTRLLGFLSSLINNSGTVKGGIMQALRGVLKLDEKYTDLITQFCCVVTNINNMHSSQPMSHVQAQEHIVTIFQSLCDQEINMIVPMYGYSGKIYDSKFVLANSLPPKDLFITICNAVIAYICSTPYKLAESRVMEGVVRGLEVISETEYGFFHLRSCMEKHGGIFKNILTTLASMGLKPESFDATWACISSMVELLRSLTSPRHGTGSNVTNRASMLTRQEFKNAVDWSGAFRKFELTTEEQMADDEDESSVNTLTTSKPIHPLTKLSKILTKFLAKLSSGSTQPHVTIETTEVENISSSLISVLEFLDEDKESTELSAETILPLPDLLQELFSKRPVFVIVEKLGSENLPPFWLTSIPPAFDLDSDYSEADLSSCDLTELCQSYLADVDILRELERFYKAAEIGNSGATDKDDSNVAERIKIKAHGDVHSPSVLSHLSSHRKPFGSPMRGNMRGAFGRGLVSAGRGLDPFRSRPPNTSRPPSLHVDDFVALESSGQTGSVAAAYNKGGIRNLDTFNPRGGRSNPRGSLLGRPYNDRGRFRLPPGGASSYFGQRLEGQSPVRRGSRGGPGKGYGGEQRWSTSESRDPSSPYSRQDHASGRLMYEDKFRSSPSSRSQLPSGVVRNPTYISRNPYREAPPMGRTNANLVSSTTLRWRDRQRPLNR